MIEVVGDLWTYPGANVRCITTNGAVKKNGECVMGRGCAWEAKNKIPGIAAELGTHIKRAGNIPYFLCVYEGAHIYSFPVKHHWKQQADLNLIAQSAEMLVERFSADPKIRIVLPRPGCGNGSRDWETEVKPILAPIFDDRFHVITFKE